LIADLPISFKLLFNFSKQASSVVALNVQKSYSSLYHFRIFCNFRFIRL